MARAATPSIGERRSARRAATHRKAVVICADAATPLVTGMAINMSRDGMGIRTYSKLPKGTAVDIEIEPRPDRERDSLIRLAGFVVRCEPAGPHEYSLGIQCRVHAPFRVRPVDRRVRSVRRPAVVDASPPPRGWRRARMAPWLAVLAAMLLLLLSWPVDRSGATSHHWADGRLHRGDIPLERKTVPPSAEDRGVTIAAFNPMHQASAREGRTWRDALDSGQPGPATLDELTGTGGPGEFVRFAETPEGGDPGRAVRMANALRSESKGYSDGEIAFASSGSTANRGADLQNSPMRDQPREGMRFQSHGERVSSVHLEVDSDAFEMTVFSYGEALWSFPVGLGKDGSTPSGEFTIFNKIPQPDWYHRGESVPYGHPRNPLGESWMGLASNGTPLSYGIHPTNESESIGAANGAGCIRMRPKDAEKLFRFCPIGATVRIASSR